jgi:hypothetical protein
MNFDLSQINFKAVAFFVALVLMIMGVQIYIGTTID